MNLIEVQDLFTEIEKCVEFYETNFLNNKTLMLYLGNGDTIKYGINPQNLPHLLGIKDLNQLKNALNINDDNILNVLKRLADNSFYIYQKMKNGILNEKDIFSSYINKKVSNFINNFTIDADTILNQTLFVCPYLSERSWTSTEKNQKYDYIIVKQLENGQISLLCLVKNQDQCYAMSNQLFDNLDAAKEVLNDLITNQEITLLTGVSISSKYTFSVYKKSINLTQKIEKIEKMMEYKQNLGCIIDISSDYQWIITKLNYNINQKKYYNSIIDGIIKSITDGVSIVRYNYDDPQILALIDAVNDCIGKTSSEDNLNETSCKKKIKKPRK